MLWVERKSNSHQNYKMKLNLHNFYLMPSFSIIPGSHCPGTWDGWMCWPATPAGASARALCPEFITGFDPTRKCIKFNFMFVICDNGDCESVASLYEVCGCSRHTYCVVSTRCPQFHEHWFELILQWTVDSRYSYKTACVYSRQFIYISRLGHSPQWKNK